MIKKILAVDDSPTILAIIQDMLESAGYEVLSAVDGQEALDKARKEKPDLIILDIMLPKLDGYKVCSMLKLDPNYKNILIIFLTALSQESAEKMCSEATADAYITKPFEPEILLSTIKELLK